jgi:hypothetical protein
MAVQSQYRLKYNGRRTLWYQYRRTDGMYERDHLLLFFIKDHL